MTEKPKPFVEALVPNAVSLKLVQQLAELLRGKEFCQPDHDLQVPDWRFLAEKNQIVLAKVGYITNEQIIGLAMLVPFHTGFGVSGRIEYLYVTGEFRNDFDVEYKLVGELITIAKARNLRSIEAFPHSVALRSVCSECHMESHPVTIASLVL